MTRFSLSPSIDDVAEMAEAALREIPEEFRAHVKDVVLRVDEFPDDETLDALGLESPFELLGLYRGVDLGRKMTGQLPADVDIIFLYRSPILDEWIDSSVALPDLIRNVLVHEIGHHFGLSDDDMHRIEDEAD